MATGNRPAADADPQSFGCDVKELKELMQLRGAEAHTVISNNYDGVSGLCARLKTHPTKGMSLSLRASLSIAIVNFVIQFSSMLAHCTHELRSMIY